MADINVERKGPSIWPWIIGLIVLALIIWALTQMFRTDDRTTQPGVMPADTPAVTDTPTQFGPGVGVDTPFGGTPPAGAPGTQPGTPPGTPQTQPTPP